MPRLPVKTERIEARATTKALMIIRRAAERDAHKAIEETQIVRLSAEDQKRFVETLLNPDEPTPAMKRAFENRQKLFGLS